MEPIRGGKIRFLQFSDCLELTGTSHFSSLLFKLPKIYFVPHFAFSFFRRYQISLLETKGFLQLLNGLVVFITYFDAFWFNSFTYLIFA